MSPIPGAEGSRGYSRLFGRAYSTTVPTAGEQGNHQATTVTVISCDSPHLTHRCLPFLLASKELSWPRTQVTVGQSDNEDTTGTENPKGIRLICPELALFSLLSRVGNTHAN